MNQLRKIPLYSFSSLLNFYSTPSIAFTPSKNSLRAQSSSEFHFLIINVFNLNRPLYLLVNLLTFW